MNAELKLKLIMMMSQGNEIAFEVKGNQEQHKGSIFDFTELHLKAKDGNITGTAKVFEDKDWVSAPIKTNYDEIINNPKFKANKILTHGDENFKKAFFNNFLANLPLLIKRTRKLRLKYICRNNTK